MIRGNKIHKEKKVNKFKRRDKSNKTKFKRRDKTMKQAITITKPWGGFLPYPPKNCPKKEFFKQGNEVIWIDLSICHNCNIIKDCSRRKDYLKSLKNKEKVI